MSNYVFLWKPYEELYLSKEILAELKELTTLTDDGWEPYESFSWDNEDNEMYPNIAKYVENTYNEYFFFIDLHSGYADD